MVHIHQFVLSQEFMYFSWPLSYCSLAYLSLMQHTHIDKWVKFRSRRISFFTNLSIITLGIWLKCLYHKKEKFSFTMLRFIPTIWWTVRRDSENYQVSIYTNQYKYQNLLNDYSYTNWVITLIQIERLLLYNLSD